MQLVRPAPRPTATATHRWQGIDQSLEHHRLAPVTQKISGMPWRSVMMWRLLPSLPLSVGLGPVYWPPGGWPRWPHPCWRG
jgi:hypothetical protein